MTAACRHDRNPEQVVRIRHRHRREDKGMDPAVKTVANRIGMQDDVLDAVRSTDGSLIGIKPSRCLRDRISQNGCRPTLEVRR